MKIFSLSKILVPLVALAFFLSACTPSVPMATPQQDSFAKSFKKSNKYANVYLYRDTFVGGAYDVTTLIDGKYAGRIKMFSYFHWKLKPGKHIIQSKAVNVSSVTLDTKANQNYFIKLQPILGLALDAKIYSADEQEGKKGVLNSKMLKSKFESLSYAPPKTKIEPTHISPSTYSKYTCQQIEQEIQRVNDKAAIVNGGLVDADSRNTQAVLFFIPLLESTEKERTELSKLLGQYNALKIVSKERKCSFSSKLK